MKSLLTLFSLFFFGAIALAQNPKTDGKVESIQMGIVLDNSLDVLVPTVQDEANYQQLTRLYRFKNTRVRKALAFRTKTYRALLA